MSEPTAMMLMPVARYELKKRGIVRVKGKGDVNTYWLNEQVEEKHFKKEEVNLPAPILNINLPDIITKKESPPNITISTDEVVSEVDSSNNLNL